MIEITIDGKKISVAEETTILAAAKANGIEIPTLCQHEGLTPDGNCRLCSVEIDEGGRKKLVASCMYPLRKSVVIDTKSERVMLARKNILQLLLDRNPNAPILLQLGAVYGVTCEERFASEPDLCVRCGRCVRACETNGNQAIELVGRGFDRHVAPPYELRPEACVGCLSCQTVCPTGKITYDESPGKRVIWKREFETLACARCGKYFATKEMLDWARVEGEDREYCERCRKALTSAAFQVKEH